MEFSHKRTVMALAWLLLLTALTQPIYTAIYLGAPEIDRQFLWGLEALVFVLLAAFAGSALVTSKRHALGFSAIAFASVLNVVQVGVGLTQFGPYRAVADVNADLVPIADATVAYSFFGYNAAKILLAMAAAVFGTAMTNQGGKMLGVAAVIVGAVAFVSNVFVMMFGLQSLLPPPVAGSSGVLATLFLALCLFRLNNEDGNQI